MLGYGNTAPYGEWQYKGEIYPDEEYFNYAKSLLIEQYRKSYINSATTTSTVVVHVPVTPPDYQQAAENLLIEQYRKEYING